MGAGFTKNSNQINTFQEAINKTVTKFMQKEVTQLMTNQIQSSTNKNTVDISDIVCGGDVKIGKINQSIVVAQDLGSITKNVSKADISSAVTATLNATQKNIAELKETDFAPFIGSQNNENIINTSNSIRNEILTETNIESIYQEFTNQIQEAQNMSKAKIRNIVCGGNFETDEIDQNIQAMQVASKLSDKVSELIFTSKTFNSTIAKQESAAKMDTGIAGVFDSIGKAVSSMIDSVGGVIGKVGGIYAVIIVAVILAVVGIIIVVVMNIGSIGSAVSGVVETGAKTGLIPPGGLGKIGKISKIGKIGKISKMQLPQAI
jgi:hypothetical protein